jgi:lysophospholipase L1-like esterase
MGDSLSDKKHNSNSRSDTWSEMLVKELKARHGVDARLVNPAIGGTTLAQNMITMFRWSEDAPKPDLVTVLFGYNDWSAGVRGELFKQQLRLAVDRIRRQTKGSADVLLITTCPAYADWETFKELEQAVRDVATEKKTGLADLAAAFRAVGCADEAMKQNYWHADKVHLAENGKKIVADVVLKALETGG